MSLAREQSYVISNDASSCETWWKLICLCGHDCTPLRRMGDERESTDIVSRTGEGGSAVA